MLHWITVEKGVAMDPIAAFNALPAERLEADLLACCAAQAWATRIAAGRPYRSTEDLYATADAAIRVAHAGAAQQASRSASSRSAGSALNAAIGSIATSCSTVIQ